MEKNTNEKKKKKTKEKISLEESAKSVQKVVKKYRYYKPPETRGVKKGTKRGTYKERETGAIKIKTLIKTRCKECGREFTYKRKGKRKREYCSEPCRQKYYRENKKRKEIERKKKLLQKN